MKWRIDDETKKPIKPWRVFRSDDGRYVCLEVLADTREGDGSAVALPSSFLLQLDDHEARIVAHDILAAAK